MKKKIIGRTKEYARLNKCMREDVAQLVLVYGRRRVGKTFLINQYYRNSFSFIDLCEMKFSLGEYSIDKEYDQKLRKRIETFRKDSKTKKAVQIVFVTTYGVESNQYSGIVQKQVTLEDLFKEIIE